MRDQYLLSTCLCILLSILFISSAAQDQQQMKPPSYPLAVRSPYLSTWLPGGSNGGVLAGAWAQFWTGTSMRWTGIIRVDGTSYLFMGPPTNNLPMVKQTSAKYTATSTFFYSVAGPINLTVTFLSPVTPLDLLRQSFPFSYLEVSFTPNDGKTHKVQIYTDIGAGWVLTEPNRDITWQHATTQTLSYFTAALNVPVEYGEYEDMAEYGQVYYSTMQGSVSYECGDGAAVPLRFIREGTLNDSILSPPASFPATPVFALAVSFDTLGTVETQSALFAIGHVRDQLIQYNNTINLPPYWSKYFTSATNALEYFLEDYENASKASWEFDAQLAANASVISPGYADLVALSARQVCGAIEIAIESSGDVLVFMKEISSDGNVNTVDVIMPSVPFWLYSNPDILRFLLIPLLKFQQEGLYPNPWAMHDMGFHYPKATGHPLGNDEKMPIEESGNMLLMSLAYTQATGDKESILETYYELMVKWADYLVNNTLIPGFQLSTTDAAGPMANQTNLAIKGIIALQAMSQIANLTNHPDDAIYYQKIAQAYVVSWMNMSMGSDGKHIKLAYQLDSSWGIQFNLMMDKVLGLNLVPESVYEILDAWYLSVTNAYGLQLDTRVDWGKTDWNMWCAAVASEETRDMIVNTTLAYIHSGDSQGPLPDRYNTTTGVAVGGIRARPTVGAHFSLLLHKKR